ncbi:hypothetical protein Aab01nite_14290 [Paractinoplanes abujensis]|uniref:Phosphoglycerol transferase MdoB-like AlkP superfamily enzyme n=1 Tax=Paractinoplanes abujensis TaxID=882441 RepID=A0A7W7CLK4_9ACTN|nr:hypothetical protein [Actinoplanes abujensis]MBB4690748.1 phosphoglycerol transferase MdoB-like AlkP superfamily enzyme [Actinoplanes abujensis]GID17839.1 hypothetical protein Aab01nite_14290 [Actinoplanes abujensis]
MTQSNGPITLEDPMRRAAAVLALVLAGLWIATPAQAFAHNAVHNAAMHALLDALTLVLVSAPVWTALLWSGGNRWWLAGLVAVVQIPVAIIGFAPIAHPYLHLSLFVIALALTAVSLRVVRRHARATTAPVKA